LNGREFDVLKTAAGGGRFSVAGKDVMRFLENVFPINLRRQLAQLATEIARRSQPAVVAVVGDRVRQISIAEARGYIRARGRRVIEEEIDELMATAPAIRNVPRGPLVEETLERIIVWVNAESVKDAPRVGTQRRAA
jgi:hypothetical protein